MTDGNSGDGSAVAAPDGAFVGPLPPASAATSDDDASRDDIEVKKSKKKDKKSKKRKRSVSSSSASSCSSSDSSVERKKKAKKMKKKIKKLKRKAKKAKKKAKKLKRDSMSDDDGESTGDQEQRKDGTDKNAANADDPTTGKADNPAKKRRYQHTKRHLDVNYGQRLADKANGKSRYHNQRRADAANEKSRSDKQRRGIKVDLKPNNRPSRDRTPRSRSPRGRSPRRTSTVTLLPGLRRHPSPKSVSPCAERKQGSVLLRPREEAMAYRRRGSISLDSHRSRSHRRDSIHSRGRRDSADSRRSSLPSKMPASDDTNNSNNKNAPLANGTTGDKVDGGKRARSLSRVTSNPETNRVRRRRDSITAHLGIARPEDIRNAPSAGALPPPRRHPHQSLPATAVHHGYAYGAAKALGWGAKLPEWVAEKFHESFKFSGAPRDVNFTFLFFARVE